MYSVLLLSCLTACRNPFFPELAVEEPEPPLPNSSPGNVLENLKKSYNNKDYNLFSSLLAPDFLFVVNSAYDDSIAAGTYDVLVYDNRPHKAWGLQKELDRHRRMFQEGTGADEIVLQFSIPDSTNWNTWPPDSGLILYVSGIKLEVTFQSEKYVVSSGVQKFYFQRQESDTSLWYIARWWDYDPEPE